MSDQTATLEIKAVRRMEPKVLGVDPKAVRKMPSGSTMLIGTFFGVIEGIKKVESTFGENLNTCFIGEFRAIHPETHQQFSSEKAYFFKALAEKLESTFNSGGGKPVEFAYKISVNEDEKSQVGYTYVAESLIPTAASDRMDAISKAIAERVGQKQLPPASEPTEASKQAANGKKK